MNHACTRNLSLNQGRVVVKTTDISLSDVCQSSARVLKEPPLIGESVIDGMVIGNGEVCRYVKRAMHGTRMMTWSELKQTYKRELVNLKNDRWVFLNTLFSVSEAVLYMQVSSDYTHECSEIP